MIKDEKIGSWYHLTCFDGSTIEWHEEEPDIRLNGNAYGPFHSFKDAKMDAIAYHKTTKDVASDCIRKLKVMKKPKKVSV